MALEIDTIVAQATPPGKGGVAVIRISGPAAHSIALSITGKESTIQLKPRYAAFETFFGNHSNFSNNSNTQTSIIDEGLLLWFPGPKSFTGEDVVELQGHGGPIVVKALLERLCGLGARMARAGEFTQRAFLNDKIDLTQAEAIADLIDANSTEAARCALQSLQGAFSEAVKALEHQVTQLRIFCEAALDFPEEEIDFLSDTRVHNSLKKLVQTSQELIKATQQGVKLRQGLSVALIGLPNAGKSSLLNCLAGEDRAIVTEIPGTTRDIVQQSITLAGYPIELADTAGLRDTSDPIEIEGIRRAHQLIARADHIFYLVDASRPNLEAQDIVHHIEHHLPQTDPQQITVLLNKIDLIDNIPSLKDLPYESIGVSAKLKLGVEDIVNRIETIVGGRGEENLFTARQRHLDALYIADNHIQAGVELLEHQGAGELLAEELKLAHLALSEITGKVSSDDMLGKIFSSFCIGK